MDHETVNFLIAEGEEGGRVDFKEVLHLDTAEQKAEFVKDVISLANLPPGTAGYLLVGVDNEKFITGCSGLEEERIQQIVGHYVRPVPVVRCQMVAMQTPGKEQVGVIQVQGDERPYSVAAPTCDLKRGQVKVRRGSVVDDATPEELRQMHNEAERQGRISGMVESAKSRLELGRFREAIRLFTQVISVAHTDEALLDRARACSQLVIEESPDDLAALRDQALDDYEDAIGLAESTQIEKYARLGRLRLCGHLDYYYEAWDEDVKWLEAKTDGCELGEVLYWKWAETDRTPGSPREALPDLSRAIALGYAGAEVYYLRAVAHYNLYNYGSALDDLEIGLRETDERTLQVEFLEFRATLLVETGQFRGAFKSLIAACGLSGKSRAGWTTIARDLEEEIIWRYSLAHRFGTLGDDQAFLASLLIQPLLVYKRSIDVRFFDHKEGERFYEIIEGVPFQFDHYSEIADTIREIARIAIPDFWEHYPRMIAGELVGGWTEK